MSLDLLPPIVVALLFLARCVEMAVRRGVGRGKILNPLTWWGMLISGFVVVGASLMDYLRSPHASEAFVISGVAIGLASFWLRARAAKALGAFWSMHIEIRKNHPLVKSGPYAFVRHPIYTAAILELIGAIVTLCSLWGAAAAAFVFLPALWARIALEERAMIAEFGEAYRKYIRTTPALFGVRRSRGGDF